MVKKKKISLYLYFSRILLVLCSTAELRIYFLPVLDMKMGGGEKVMHGDFQPWNLRKVIRSHDSEDAQKRKVGSD